MASDFVGYSVLVTLKSPPNCRVQGVVADVVGQRLTLQDVTLLWNGQRAPVYHIEAPGIADLELQAQQGPGGGAAQQTATGTDDARGSSDVFPEQQQQQRLTTPAPVSTPSQNDPHQPLLDPAILSFSRPPRSQHNAQPNVMMTTAPNVPSPVMIGDSEVSESSRATQTVPMGSQAAHAPQVQNTTATAATLSAPFSDLELNSGNGFAGHNESAPAEGTPGPVVPEGRKGAGPLDAPLKYTGKRSRRGGRGKPQKDVELQATGIPEGAEPEPASTGSKKKGFAGKGWRQTSFMEPAESVPSPTPKHGRGRQSKGKGHRNQTEESGWATEDATDIQEMGDFDFQSNLSKFDKRRVFDEIRNDDTKSGQELLVSINRRTALPGTNGGKNLHYTENVLDPSPPQKLAYISESGETDVYDGTDGQFNSGRNSSKGRSKSSMQGSSSRKGSGVLQTPVPSSQFAHFNRGQLTSSRTSSPRSHIQSTAPPASSMSRSSNTINGSFQITTTNRRCPIVSPLQMLEIEQLAISELGLTDDIITENSGRGIAEAAVALTGNLPVSSQILIFVGNHKTGSRAVCAARHFRNRGYRITLCILGAERENEFTDVFRKQIDIFKKAGGRVLRWDEISTRLSTVDNTPALIVDALFGVHMSLEDLRSDDQAAVFEMIAWANRSGAEILSVDIPFGLSATSGEEVQVQGTALSANATYVVCLGAPKSGLVNALAAGEGSNWQIAVADVGISQGAWKKFGTRRRHGVDFGNKWVVPLRYQPTAA